MWSDKVLALAQRRGSDAVLVTELSRWGRSTTDLLAMLRLAPKVLALVAQGRSYRPVGREVGLSKNTVVSIVGRNRAIA